MRRQKHMRQKSRVDMVNKYNARKVKIDGYTFDSQREAQRYGELKLMEKAGEIKELVVHPGFLLQEGFQYQGKSYQPIIYIADFIYMENGKTILEDVKGVETPDFRMKWKILLFFAKKSRDNAEFRIVR